MELISTLLQFLRSWVTSLLLRYRYREPEIDIVEALDPSHVELARIEERGEGEDATLDGDGFAEIPLHNDDD